MIFAGNDPLRDCPERGHGQYGPKTERVIKTFQEDQGISVTGVVDEETYKRLFPQDEITDVETQNNHKSVNSLQQSVQQVYDEIYHNIDACRKILTEFLKVFHSPGKDDKTTIMSEGRQ